MVVSFIIHPIIMHYQVFGALTCSISKGIFTLLMSGKLGESPEAVTGVWKYFISFSFKLKLLSEGVISVCTL